MFTNGVILVHMWIIRLLILFQASFICCVFADPERQKKLLIRGVLLMDMNAQADFLAALSKCGVIAEKVVDEIWPDFANYYSRCLPLVLPPFFSSILVVLIGSMTG